MAEYEKLVRAELTAHGCTFVRHGKGDHDIWYSQIGRASCRERGLAGV